MRNTLTHETLQWAMERAHFNPGRLDPCFCRSGKRFKSCCGSRAIPRPPPFSVHVVNDFLSRAEREEMVHWADQQPGEAMKVLSGKLVTPGQDELRKSQNRLTDKVELGEKRSVVEGWLRRAVNERVEPAFQREIAWFEAPNLMRYSQGGWFRQHADSEYYDHERRVWIKSVDRDISLLLYLNDDFRGGALHFPVFNYRYKPRPGDLVFFPSDGRFQHEAERIESGSRYAIASWLAVKNAPRIHEGMPAGAVSL